MADKNILVGSISDARTSDSCVPARVTYRVDATVAGDRTYYLNLNLGV